MSLPLSTRIAEGSRWFAAGLVAIVAMRFAWHAIDTRDARAAAGKPAASGAPDAAPAPLRTASPDATARVVAPGVSIRPRLVVTRQPDRATVYVDGMPLGKTPYLGECTCKAGATVVIEIVASTGGPQRFERPCATGVIRVE